MKLNCLYLYLTDSCNMDCIHCWQSAKSNESLRMGVLRFEDCKRFLDTAIKMGLQSVIFSGGEPLLNPDFEKFTAFLSKHSISMTIETNGLLLSDDRIFNCVRKHNVYCAISLDGINEATHNEQRGRNDAFAKTCRNIDKLDAEGMNFQLIMAVSKFNYCELPLLLDEVKKRWSHCNTFKINIVNMMGRGVNMAQKGLLFEPDELPAITEEVAGLIKEYPFKVALHVNPVFFSFKNLMKQYSCGGHCGYKTSLSVLANGNISICSLGKQVDKYVFGHIASSNLEEIWDANPLLNEIHGSMYQKISGICSNCIFRKKCLGGCRAESLWNYGDFFGPNPVCQSYYDSGKFPSSRLRNPAMDASYVNDN